MLRGLGIVLKERRKFAIARNAVQQLSVFTMVPSSRKIQIMRFLDRIVVNAGIGRLAQNPNFEEKALPQILRDIALLAGQKPQIRRAYKSIAGFKLRKGQIVGLRVTLRRGKMVDFFERLISIILPRVKDFNGINQKSIDQAGVLNIGFKDQFAFPEINLDDSPVTFSLGVNIVPKVRKRDEVIEMYRKLGVPLK